MAINGYRDELSKGKKENKMKKIIFLTCILLSISGANDKYIDLGIYGDMNVIKEKDLMHEIREKSKSITKEKMTEAMQKSIEKYFKVKSNLSLCLKTQDRYLDPTVVLDNDIDLSNFGVFIPKGTTINPLSEALYPGYIIFIDAEDPLQIALASQFNRAASGSSIVIVANGDMAKARIITEQVYKYDAAVQRTFKPECLPSIYVQQEDKFLIREYSLRKKTPKENK